MTTLGNIPLTDELVSSRHIFPVGMIVAFAGSGDPAGWLLCDGRQPGSGAAGQPYEALFNAIGTTYGGSSATTFLIPDLRGRTVVGPDNMGTGAGGAGRLGSLTHGTANTTTHSAARGNSGGTEAYQISANESGMPSHGHGHNISVNPGSTGAVGPTNGLLFDSFSQSRYSNSGYSAADGFYLVGSHGHGVSGGVSNAAGVAAANRHTNMPPYQIVNWIIKV
jgi:microcystin-dependent protein